VRLCAGGDVLITHKGLSGPAALSISREAALFSDKDKKCAVVADLFPDLTDAVLEAELLRHAVEKGSQMIRKFLQMCPIAPTGGLRGSSLNGTIPTALVPLIMKHAGLEEDVTWSTLPKIGRKKLLTVLKRFPLGEVGRVPLEQGEGVGRWDCTQGSQPENYGVKSCSGALSLRRAS